MVTAGKGISEIGRASSSAIIVTLLMLSFEYICIIMKVQAAIESAKIAIQETFTDTLMLLSPM